MKKTGEVEPFNQTLVNRHREVLNYEMEQCLIIVLMIQFILD